MNRAVARSVAVLLCIVSASAVFGETRRVSSSRDFANSCGTGSKYKNCDRIVLLNDITLSDDITINKDLTIASNGSSTYTIKARNSRQFEINPGNKLTLTNVVFDGENYTGRTDGLFRLNESSVSEKIAELEMQSGAVIKRFTIGTNADAEHAPIYIEKGGRFTMNDGAAILHCANNSYHGNGGAICCDSGNVIINGGMIAGCAAKGSGGAIFTAGERIAAEDHLGLAMRGDIVLYGGFITNNVCGDGSAYGVECFGGGIYLGGTGPMLHVIGSVIVSNNVCRVKKNQLSYDKSYDPIPDDVSTYLLRDDHANRLKLTGDKTGRVFTDGWVGVRYPDLRTLEKADDLDREIRKKRFGEVWEYVTTSHEESRQFFWNGDNRYRGWINGNALVWTRHKIYQLPHDRTTVLDVILAADTNFPVYIEFDGGYIMDKVALNDSHIRIPEGFDVTFDLQGHSITCNLEVASGGRVTFCDSSTNRSGRVWGYRDVASDIVPDSPAFTNAYRIEGGSYHTKPNPAWIDPDCVLIGNYCKVHPWMVARLAWETNLTSRIADATLVTLDHVDDEIRNVGYDAQTGKFDIDEISYSSGDWKLNAHTNANMHVRVLAAPAVVTESGELEEVAGARVALFDSGAGGILDDGNVSFPLGAADREGRSAVSFGREDTFVWAAKSFGLVKMIHITYKKSGLTETTNAVEQAYFRFPEAAFRATQRKTGEGHRILLSDIVLSAFGYNRAGGFLDAQVNDLLDGFDANGLRRWENFVTGTDTNRLVVSTVKESSGGEKLLIALTEPGKIHRDDAGYLVHYDLRKSTPSGWVRVGEVRDRPEFEVDLLDANGVSAGAGGFYRVTTLIVPNDKLSVTNEIASTNIVGVLEVSSRFKNTLTAVPWVSLRSHELSETVRPVTVSNFMHTAHLENGDAVQVADAGHIFHGWKWEDGNRNWKSFYTVTEEGVVPEADAGEYEIARDNAVWVTRPSPGRPYFLVGQYSSEDAVLKIAAGTRSAPVCTLVPNPSLSAVKVNDYPWGDNPVPGDLVRLQNEQKAPIALIWNAQQRMWGAFVPTADGQGVPKWVTDWEVPSGQGFWYHRCGAGYEMILPVSKPATD